jgi:hypothetical protein
MQTEQQRVAFGDEVGLAVAISVDTAVTVTDWWKLGEAVANTSSENQIRFLIGMARRFDSPWGPMQMQYISQATAGLTGVPYLRKFAEMLAEYFPYEGERTS